jgi:hypothetical protein
MKIPIIEKLRSIFPTGRIDIHWFDYDRRRIVGHTGKPKVGDVFTSKMKSGKIGVFEVTKVDWQMDPRNMYFADVKDVGYWEYK